MSRKDLIKTIQDFASECDKFARTFRGAAATDSELTHDELDTINAKAKIFEAHRDWANNLIPKI